MNSATLVQKLWNYCNVLRDDGTSYGDYVEQLTYLLFLKMAEERSRPPYSQASPIPATFAWPPLLAKDGDALFDHYRHTLEELGRQPGTLALIFGKAQNKFQDPAKLRRAIVDLIDAENWSAMGADVKGDAYEGLLERNAQDIKSGAGQYFTARPLIQAMVDCVAPRPDNVLFEGGAGETIRRKLMHECEVHALLRLPTGLFYAQGVKANVLFFDKKPASETPWTKTLWIFDLRTNKHLTLKTNPLKRADLDEFVALYSGGKPGAVATGVAPTTQNRHQRQATWSAANPEGHWRAYDHDEIVARDKASLDIFWLKDESLADSENLPPPEVIAQEIVEDLEAELEQFRLIAGGLGNGAARDAL